MPIPKRPPGFEKYFFIDLHGDGDPVFRSRFELPVAHAFSSAFIQAEAQGPHDLNVMRTAIGVDHQRQQHATLELGKSRFIGVYRHRFRNYEGRGDARPQAEHRRLRRGSVLRAQAEAYQKAEPSSDVRRVQVSVIAHPENSAPELFYH